MLKKNSFINSNEYIIGILTILIIFLLGTSTFNFETIKYYNYQININIILSSIFFLGIIALKNTNKIKMYIILNRFTLNNLIIIITYNISTISLLTLMILIGNINSLIGIIIIGLEVTILIINFYINFNNKISRDIISVVLFKEIHYTILMMCLILNNFPFEILNIPMTVILSSTYIIVQGNLIYAYLENKN